MAAELVPHGREDLLGVGVILPRAEAGVERRGEHVGRDGLLDGGHDGPAALAGVLHDAGVVREAGVLDQGHRREVEEPRPDDRPAAPHLGDVGEVEVVAVLRREFLGVGRLEDVETFGVGLHQAVLDAVVDHLHVVAGARGAAVEVAVLGGRAGDGLAAGGALDVADARGQRLEDRVEVLHGLIRAAHHHAVAAGDPPHAAGGADVNVVNSLGLERRGATDVILEVGIAAVDDRVAGFHQLGEVVDGRLGGVAAGDHDPRRAGLRELRDEFLERRGADGPLGDELGDALGAAVVDDAGVTGIHQAADHIAAHSAQTNHAQLHGTGSFLDATLRLRRAGWKRPRIGRTNALRRGPRRPRATAFGIDESRHQDRPS